VENTVLGRCPHCKQVCRHPQMCQCCEACGYGEPLRIVPGSSIEERIDKVRAEIGRLRVLYGLNRDQWGES